MLRARNGERLIFGLTEENIQRLRKGQPILIDLVPLGRPGEIVIFYGRDYPHLTQQLKQALQGETNGSSHHH